MKNKASGDDRVSAELFHILKDDAVKVLHSIYQQIWLIKKAERQRTVVFKPWCWRRFLRIPWTAKKSNHSILKELNVEYSLEELMLKL